MMRVSKGIGLALCALASLGASPAKDDQAQELCLADSIEGQVLQSHGRLLRAREHLAACARSECELAMREHCVAWLREAADATPSLRILVEDDMNRPLPRAVLHLDATLTDPSRPVAVDPGKHVLVVEYAGRHATLEINATRGEQTVHLVVDLRARVQDRPTPKTAYVLAGLTGASAIAFAGFGVSALVQSNDLNACAPYCSGSKKAPLHVAMIGADVSAGVAGAALLSAVIVYLARPTRTQEVRVGDGVARMVWAF